MFNLGILASSIKVAVGYTSLYPPQVLITSGADWYNNYTGTTGTRITVSDSTTSENDSAYPEGVCCLSSSVALVQWLAGSANTDKLLLLTRSGTTLTKQNSVTLDNTINGETSIKRINDTTAIVAAGSSDTSTNREEVFIATISGGTTVVKNTAFNFAGTLIDSGDQVRSPSCAMLTDTIAVISWSEYDLSTTTWYQKARTVSISGTTITGLSSEITVLSAAAGLQKASEWVDDSHVLLTLFDSTAGDGKAYILRKDGSSLSVVGSATTISSLAHDTVSCRYSNTDGTVKQFYVICNNGGTTTASRPHVVGVQVDTSDYSVTATDQISINHDGRGCGGGVCSADEYVFQNVERQSVNVPFATIDMNGNVLSTAVQDTIDSPGTTVVKSGLTTCDAFTQDYILTLYRLRFSGTYETVVAKVLSNA